MYKIRVSIGSQVGYLPRVYDNAKDIFNEVDRLNILAASTGSLAVYEVAILD
jgi:hypothetical protein